MCITHGLQSLMGCILPMMHCRSQHCWELLHPFAQCWELLHLFALSWTHITEHSKTSKWVLKLQFLTLRQDHKDPFTFMSETHLNPPSPPPPNPRLLNPKAKLWPWLFKYARKPYPMNKPLKDTYYGDQCAICTMMSFYHYFQNTSGFCFLVQRRAFVQFVIETSMGIPHLNRKIVIHFWTT